MDDPGHLVFDPRRTFTRPEVFRAWTLQGQVCNLCRRAIPFDLLHGDHVVPWILGGKTEFANLQALCGSCNLRKGSRHQEVVEQHFVLDHCAPGRPPLRRWQSEAIPMVLDELTRGPVLVEACPGAGKTRFGLEIAYRMLEPQEISRVLIVVPTLGIADGWLRSASSARQVPDADPEVVAGLAQRMAGLRDRRRGLVLSKKRSQFQQLGLGVPSRAGTALVPSVSVKGQYKRLAPAG